jgi:hypothetical protein
MKILDDCRINAPLDETKVYLFRHCPAKGVSYHFSSTHTRRGYSWVVVDCLPSILKALGQCQVASVLSVCLAVWDWFTTGTELKVFQAG